MKNYLKLLVGFILISFCTSCSEEEIHEDHNILGVWETTVSSHTYTLVFGEHNTGLSIETMANDAEVTSSAISFSWMANNKDIVITDGNTMQRNYSINAEGELVLSPSNLRFLKVSNDYSRYY
ncbi:hypothetical protein [Aestuariivivens sediminis]|uniref:hypothetical protein n=1 Tax=Aestuariivivens sediminis TaxID=2913557 RepID=UPI001F55B737|nr:hypothetical protein [Aestuariivivens sediminis]